MKNKCKTCSKQLKKHGAIYCKSHRIVTSKTRKKLSMAMIGNQRAKGRKNIKGFQKGCTAWNKGIHHQKIRGEKHYGWKGGISRNYKNGYNSLEYKLWREMVFERDDYICQECSKSGYITAHHIKSFSKYPKLRYELANGKTLCEDCHSETDNYKGRAKNTSLERNIKEKI